MDSVISAHHVERVRAFNRYYTRRIGVLTDQYLGQRRPLGEARLLFEIEGRAEVRDLRARLQLDPGYLSRLMQSLERQGLVKVRAKPGDRRVRTVELTEAGRRERSGLDQRAVDGVSDLLQSLTPAQRQELVEAQFRVSKLLRLAELTIRPVDVGSPEARYCLDSYAAELDARFPGGYDKSVQLTPADLEDTPGSFFVAFEGDVPVGCCGWVLIEDALAEVRHLWVSADARRLGVGGRLLDRIEADAASRGATTMRLGTHSALPEATALYLSCGYQEIPLFEESPYYSLAFAKALPPR